MRRYLPIVLSAILFLLPNVSQAQKLFKSRTQLQRQIDSLREALESMSNEYNALVEAAQEADSIGEEDVDDDFYSSDNGFMTMPEQQGDIDSLLTIWYLQRSASISDYEFVALDSTILVSNVPDAVYFERLKAINSFIPLPYNDVIRNYIILYTEKKRALTSNIIGLASYWMPQLEAVFDRYGLPQELKAVAVIESALKPTAVSRAGAKGMWQFMYTAARQYKLNITSYVDERLDPLKAADAAARYLKDSYSVFGDWLLAIASYNCGSGNVNKAIRKAGGSRDFWEIYPYLPRETRGYVPAFVAALYTLKYYPEHNIIPNVANMPASLDTFQISRMTHFEQIAHYTGVSVQELRDYNPQYLHDIIPGSLTDTYVLNLPFQYTNAYVDWCDSIPCYNDTVYFSPARMTTIKQKAASSASSGKTYHKVKSGETLSRIAAKYHTSVAKIKKWNNLKSDRITVGQRLIIYR